MAHSAQTQSPQAQSPQAQSPQAKYRKDYQAPSHQIVDIDLTFELDDNATTVVAVSEVEQRGECNRLVLDGENLSLLAVSVNGEEWPHYQVSENHLILEQGPF